MRGWRRRHFSLLGGPANTESGGSFLQWCPHPTLGAPACLTAIAMGYSHTHTHTHTHTHIQQIRKNTTTHPAYTLIDAQRVGGGGGG